MSPSSAMEEGNAPVTNLVNRGWVHRGTAQGDGRAVLLLLTAAGTTSAARQADVAERGASVMPFDRIHGTACRPPPAAPAAPHTGPPRYEVRLRRRAAASTWASPG
ncbi:hypothetical protein ACLQ28_10460 [Micromonospora sp. DT201]|uniref:hypothetical protein n=1 Tax=Micromonospora sp. DT201 TaxID=3393442 RepID=UPI003CE8ECEB